MRQQHEITTSAPLLGKDGDLLEPGWARSLLPVYRRADIKASPMRIKEWDYYLITDGHIGLALTIADNGYMGLDSISFLHFDEGWEQTTSRMRALPLGKTHLPESSAEGASEVARGGYAMTFYHEDGLRKLSFHMDKFRGKDAIEGIIQLSDEPIESMVIATPFDKPGHFYYNQKINCMRAEGWIELGDRRFELTPFGWNIGYGFGNTEAATENVLFYDGRIHKLSEVRFEIPMDEDGFEDFMKPWVFTSDDNRFYMNFTPVLDRSAFMSAGVVLSDQHQVFGRFTGRITLDDGTVLPVRDFFGFAEKVENKW